MTQEKLNYETPIKPTMENVKEVIADGSEFENELKAEALFKHLGLAVGSKVQSSDDEYYIINPRYELRGHSPQQYKTEIEHLKALCTPKMLSDMTRNIKRKTKKDKFYYTFTKQLDKREKTQKNKNVRIDEAIAYFNQEDSFKKTVAGLHSCVYHLLDKESKLNLFVLAWFNKPLPNTQEWRETNDGEYRVLTDEEADNACNDYLDDSRDSWVESVKANNTDESFEDWKESVKNNDGRGNQLGSYDGNEEEITINDTTYYIYRTN